MRVSFYIERLIKMPRIRQAEKIKELMSRKDRIRNVGIVAHIDHGKTTLADCLLADAGLISSSLAGQLRALDYLDEEQRRGITLKTAYISLVHDDYLINLVDTPGH
ncbi:MAG: GTP-binding protein [Candidatus Helarchaeales archaeon]